MSLGDELDGGRIVSVVRSGGEIVQVGVRGPIRSDGYADHWGYVLTDGALRRVPGQRAFFVGQPIWKTKR